VRTTLRSAAVGLSLVLLSAAPVASSAATAAPRRDAGPTGVTFLSSLGGGTEVGRSESTGLAELELGLGYDVGQVRPEVALLLGLAPGTYAGIRPGVHLPLAGTPFYARAALDWAHQGGDWGLRWLVAGGGAELRLTSVLGIFAAGDVGLPLTSDRGVALLARAGFAFRL
jgi:hypothetical protein